MSRYSGIVQSVEQRTVNPYVTGSSPVARATDSAGLSKKPRFLFFSISYLFPTNGALFCLFSRDFIYNLQQHVFIAKVPL